MKKERTKSWNRRRGETVSFPTINGTVPSMDIFLWLYRCSDNILVKIVAISSWVMWGVSRVAEYVENVGYLELIATLLTTYQSLNALEHLLFQIFILSGVFRIKIDVGEDIPDSTLNWSRCFILQWAVLSAMSQEPHLELIVKESILRNTLY